MAEQNVDGITLKNIDKIIRVALCNRCLYEWEPQLSVPKRCAKCNSPYWNKERCVPVNAQGKVNKYGFDKIEIGKWSEFPTYETASGGVDVSRNATFWRSLEQYMRRHGYAYAWEGSGKTFRVMRRT